VMGGGGGGAKPKKKFIPRKKLERKKIFPGIVQKKKIPSLEDRPINFNKKIYFQPSSEKKNKFLL
jgi:hypothetical protein